MDIAVHVWLLGKLDFLGISTYLFAREQNGLFDLAVTWNISKITTTKRGHCCSRSASGKVRFLGHKNYIITT